MESKAIELFKEIKYPGDIVLNLLFNACAQLGTDDALNLTKQVSSKMIDSFQSNSRLMTSLLDALVKCGDIEYAEKLFLTFKKKTITMYRVMINGFLRENNSLKILDLFNHMKINNVQIDSMIWTCIIKALANIGDYELSRSIIEQIPKSCSVDNQMRNALIHLWVS